MRNAQLVVAMVTWFFLACPSPAALVTVDFSEVSPPDTLFQYLEEHGIDLTARGTLWIYQGDQVITGAFGGEPLQTLGIIGGNFSPKIKSLQLNVSPDVQAVVDYTLTAYDANAQEISSVTVQTNLWESDPGFQGWGFTTIDLGELSRPAQSFTLKSELIRGPWDIVDLGVSSLTYNQVPEPSSIALAAVALAGFIALGRRKRV